MFSFGINIRSITKVKKARPANPPNNSKCESLPYSPPIRPANKFPEKHIKNHPPIVSDKNCFGASFDTSDKPIGDKQSSDSVIIKYPATSHNGEIKLFADKYPANAKMMYEKVIKIKAMANFSTEVGSLSRCLRFSHSSDMRGASVIIKNGFKA